MARPRVPVPLSDIEEEFRAQLGFLKSSCEAYDLGNTDEFRRIALAIRILVYHRGQSKSVICQLGLEMVKFHVFSPPVDPTNMFSETPLVAMRVGPEGATYFPCLNAGPYGLRRLLLDDWWSEEIFRSPGGVSMARSGFVLHTANQAGGAHVDPELDEEFHKISRENEAGWIFGNNLMDDPSNGTPIDGLERACVRQIGFEVLATLEPEWARIFGNRLCDCGSGRKYRYCHGK